MLRTERVANSFLQRREKAPTEKGFTVYGQVNKRRVRIHADPGTERRGGNTPTQTCRGEGSDRAGEGHGGFGKGGSDGKVRSGQVRAPVHRLPAHLGAPRVNFLSGETYFFFLRKAEGGETCERREEPGLREEAPAPAEGSGCRFPKEGGTRGDASRPPLCCATNPGTTQEGGFSS